MGHQTRERAWNEIERRIVCGELPGGTRLDEDTLAGDLGVETQTVREALCRLERDGYVQPEEDGSFSVAPLSEIEVREGYPVAILLEGLAVRTTPSFPPEALVRLHQINGAMASERDDAMAAATHDWEFHDELVSHCGNEQLLSTLRPLKRLMLRYEYAYMSAEELVAGAVDQHARILEALEGDDHETAAALVEDNFRTSLPGILDQL
ncbi:MAG TPA: GntR family transcriptional regulator [Solirubrobacteraceae bacterium]